MSSPLSATSPEEETAESSSRKLQSPASQESVVPVPEPLVGALPPAVGTEEVVAPEDSDMELSQSTAAASVPECTVVAPDRLPPIDLLITGLGSSVVDLGSPRTNAFHRELDEFAEQLRNTGVFPDPLVEGIVREHTDEVNPPTSEGAAGMNAHVRSLFDVGRAVGVEVARANSVLLDQFFVRQGLYVFCIWSNSY